MVYVVPPTITTVLPIKQAHNDPITHLFYKHIFFIINDITTKKASKFSQYTFNLCQKEGQEQVILKHVDRDARGNDKRPLNLVQGVVVLYLPIKEVKMSGSFSFLTLNSLPTSMSLDI